MRQCAVKVLPQIGGEGRVEKKASISIIYLHFLTLGESLLARCLHLIDAY